MGSCVVGPRLRFEKYLFASVLMQFILSWQLCEKWGFPGSCPIRNSLTELKISGLDSLGSHMRLPKLLHPIRQILPHSCEGRPRLCMSYPPVLELHLAVLKYLHFQRSWWHFIGGPSSPATVDPQPFRSKTWRFSGQVGPIKVHGFFYLKTPSMDLWCLMLATALVPPTSVPSVSPTKQVPSCVQNSTNLGRAVTAPTLAS